MPEPIQSGQTVDNGNCTPRDQSIGDDVNIRDYQLANISSFDLENVVKKIEILGNTVNNADNANEDAPKSIPEDQSIMREQQGVDAHETRGVDATEVSQTF